MKREKRHQIGLRLPEELNREVEKAAAKRYLSKNGLIIMAIQEYLENDGKAKKAR